MRLIRQNGKAEIDISKETAYAEFRATMDAELKHLKQAESGTSDSRRGRVALGEGYPWGISTFELCIFLQRYMFHSVQW